MDQNPANPGAVLDYQCGSGTYDVSGYNHKGIDMFTWPFGWYETLRPRSGPARALEILQDRDILDPSEVPYFAACYRDRLSGQATPVPGLRKLAVAS